MILKGKAAAPGFAAGRVYVHILTSLKPKETHITEQDVQEHLDRYQEVKKLAYEQLDILKKFVEKKDPKKADIFWAHQEILEDIIINEEIPNKIKKDLWSADTAIYNVYETIIETLKQTKDPIIAERSVDFDDVRTLLLRKWFGQKEDGFKLSEPMIIVTHELKPSDVAFLDGASNVLAILSETGGISGHTAIIAKSYGIPAVFGLEGIFDKVKHGQLAAVNAYDGTVILNPDEATFKEYKKRNDELKKEKQESLKYLSLESKTEDGEKIDICLNISGASQKDLDFADYTDSVGLFRTEFLYMDREIFPSEDEQIECYKKVLQCYKDRPVVIRTLDIGGDKDLPYLPAQKEDNPFLGNRGLRFCFSHPGIFKTQIRAALQASKYGNLYLMLPMITSIDDIIKAKEIIASIEDELKSEGKPVSPYKLGIMVEIPSIALVASHACDLVDFASIGTNDLTQYICAADRMNSEVEGYYQSFHPAVFKMIQETTRAFGKCKKPVSICGELASDPLAMGVLIGLGIRKLSMGASSVAKAKKTISALNIKKCEETAAFVLELSTETEVKEYLLKGSC